MATIYKVDCQNRMPLSIGVQEENLAHGIQFDITPWIEEHGAGAVTANAQRPTDAVPYPVIVQQDGNIVTWRPKTADVAIEGTGAFQLIYTVGEVVARTRIWATNIGPSLIGAGDPPDPFDDWLDDMREVAADAQQSANDSAASAQQAAQEVLNAQNEVKNAEAWAVGQRGGVDVPSTDPTYENNAKYWAEQSAENQYSAFIVKSASGDIASFADGGDDIPMKSLKVTITPKQAGSGDPSPSNVRAITGWTGANVTVEGINVWDEEWESGSIDANGNPVVLGGNIRSKNFIRVAPSTSYFYNVPSSYSPYGWIHEYDENYNWIRMDNIYTQTVFTTSSDCKYIKFRTVGSTYNNDISINYPSTDTEYHPYTGHTTPVPLGQTVYGGTVNPISGELKITHAYSLFDGTESWYLYQNNAYTYAPNSTGKSGTAQDGWCNIAPTVRGFNSGYGVLFGNENNAIYFLNATTTWGVSDVAGIKAYIAQHNCELVYPLKNPTTVQLTPAQVATLLGQNNVWSDAGDVAVEYRADPTLAYNELANVIVSLGGNI